MPMVIGVRFKNAGKLYYFNPGSLTPAAGDSVIVETARGIEYAEAVMGVHEVGDNRVQAPLKRVMRIATPQDAAQHQNNQQSERDAHRICHDKISEHKLDMKLVRVEYTFDRSKLIAYFTSNGRVDFRALVKDLAATFKTRIELKQIGVRDEAKMLGGLGTCGRSLCCSEFLGDFQPVSIKMAKEQNLSLNPTKISGVCGRLMCCLKYEQEQYERAKKLMPHVGRDAITPDGRGVVVEVNALRERVKVRLPKGNDGSEIREYDASEVQRVAPPPAASKAAGLPPKGQQSRKSPRKADDKERRDHRPAKDEPSAADPNVDEEFIETVIDDEKHEETIED